MRPSKFYKITGKDKPATPKKISNRTELIQSPEVAEYQKGQLIYYLRNIGHGKNRKLIRFEGYVERPLYTQVLCWWIDHLGCWHQDKIKPSKLEKRTDE